MSNGSTNSLVSGSQVTERLIEGELSVGKVAFKVPGKTVTVSASRPTFGQHAKVVVWEGVKTAGFEYVKGRVFGSPNLTAVVMSSTAEAVAKKTVGAVITFIGKEETKGGKVAYVVCCFFITSVNIVALRIFGLTSNTDVIKASMLTLTKLGYNLHQILRPEEHKKMLDSLPSFGAKLGARLVELIMKEQIESLAQESDPDGSQSTLDGLVD